MTFGWQRETNFNSKQSHKYSVFFSFLVLSDSRCEPLKERDILTRRRKDMLIVFVLPTRIDTQIHREIEKLWGTSRYRRRKFHCALEKLLTILKITELDRETNVLLVLLRRNFARVTIEESISEFAGLSAMFNPKKFNVVQNTGPVEIGSGIEIGQV